MEGERTFMKNKKLLAKLIFVAILLLIIWYTFKDSAEDIVEQLGKTSLTVLVAIMAATVIYHLFEAWITYSLARRYNPKFKYREAVYCAFYCSFYRLSTLGSGSGVAAIVYLGKKGVGYSEATGLYMIQYMVHKVSVALFSGLLFVLNWKVMSCNYREYGVYLGLGISADCHHQYCADYFCRVGEITQTDSGDRASFQQERQTDTGFDETGAEL